MFESSNRKVSQPDESGFPWGSIATLAIAFAILFFGMWFALKFTESKNKRLESKAKEVAADSNPMLSRRSKQMLSAQNARQKLLEMDKKIQSKHARNKGRHSASFSSSRKSSYRSWQKQKEQTQRHYRKFKNDVTNDPNSVKLQMQKTLRSLEEDRPDR